MAFTLKELAENPSLLRDLRKRAAASHGCAGCGVTLQETITGKRQLQGRDVCSDCYYEAFGNFIEEYPIVSAGKRRS
jgi:protein-arginine kinase activator protein McsA